MIDPLVPIPTDKFGFIVRLILSPEIKKILEPIVNNEIILGGIIDMVCLASKGKLKINKNRKRCFCL